MKQKRIEEIERAFRILGLGEESERERMLKLIQMAEPKNEPIYQIYTAGDTKALQEAQNAKLESNPQ